MKLIKPSWDIMEQGTSLEGIYEQIELAGRTCYKSKGTRYFNVPLLVEDYKLNPIVKKARKDSNVVCNVPSLGECALISMRHSDVINYPGIEECEVEPIPEDKSKGLWLNLTAKDFVDKMISSGHYSMLEHGTVYLLFKGTEMSDEGRHSFYETNPYSKVYRTTLAETGEVPHFCVTTNYRVLVENDRLEDLQFICTPGKHHVKRVTVKFVTDRGVSHELVRHRLLCAA